MSDVHSTGAPCIGQNPTCPCQDGDACHYEDTPTTKGWPVPDDQTGALRQQPEAVDHDPLDSPLPCDFKTPRMKFSKGVSLRTVLMRMERLEEAAFGPLPTPEQQARNLEVLRGNLPLTEWQGDSPIGLAGRSIGWCAVCVGANNYVHHSRIVRTKHDAESIVKQWADSWGKFFKLDVIQLHQRPTESAVIPEPPKTASGSHQEARSDEQGEST